MNNKDLLINGLSDFYITINEEQLKQFDYFYNLVIDTNKKFNLTAILDEQSFILKHFIDSSSVVPLIPENSTVCDIGAGAGFPSMPICILRPDIKLTAFDSTAKKMNFLASAARDMNIKNLQTIVGRIEEYKDYDEYFDFGVARAVASLPILLEIVSQKIKIGGKFIAFKTDESELKNIDNCLEKLNFIFNDSVCFTLPNGDNRSLLIFEKTDHTPNCYPRQYGIIKKKPL